MKVILMCFSLFFFCFCFKTRKVLLSKLLVKHHNPLSVTEMETLARYGGHYISDKSYVYAKCESLC